MHSAGDDGEAEFGQGHEEPLDSGEGRSHLRRRAGYPFGEDSEGPVEGFRVLKEGSVAAGGEGGIGSGEGDRVTGQGVGDPGEQPVAGGRKLPGAELYGGPVGGDDPADGGVGEVVVALESYRDDAAGVEDPEAGALVVIGGEDERGAGWEVFETLNLGIGLEAGERLLGEGSDGIAGFFPDVGGEGEDLAPGGGIMLHTSLPFQMALRPVSVVIMPLMAMAWKP